jgi:hypothetical protein
MIQHHIPEDMNFQQDRCGNLRLYTVFPELKLETDILLELVLQTLECVMF